LIYRKVLLIIALSIGLMLSLSMSGSEAEELPQLLLEDEYPQDLDTLEEFIQSYYLLLDSDSYLKSYKFIHPGKNKFQNDDKGMQEFYRKLLELRNARRDRVVVYQIGDSHIQSGYFSGTARSSLQKYYGNAGRGLIFPLKAVRTNQPDDYRFSLSGSYQKSDSPRSFGGYSLLLDGSTGLDIKTNNFYNIDSRFNEALVFADSLASLKASDNLWAQRQRIEDHGAYSAHYLRLPEYAHECQINLGSSFKALYGVSLERSEGGILYHSMGINGAGFYTLKDQDELYRQIAMLQPDLIIVSLGTNDAQGNYRAEVARANIQSFMQGLESANPQSAILFTLPPDSYKRGKQNADLAKLEKEITDYAKVHGHAWWDLSEVMGGKNSVSKWRNHNMAARDLLHYTPKGYMLQGHLLYQAFIKGYKRYSEVREIK
jgi:lysophospholipase L1-like esterase